MLFGPKPLGPDRWFLPKEVLATQVFPVAACVRDSPPACSFNVPRASRRRETVKGQAGNSMNVIVAGAAYLYSLLAVQRVGDASQRLAALVEARRRCIGNRGSAV